MIPASHAHLRVAAASHAGMSGKNNEDRYAVSAFQIDGAVPIPALLAIVADGIGGHRAGEIAAEIAVETISRVVADSDAKQPVQTLQEAIIRAAKSISDESEANPEQKGMGSTCACVWVIGSQLYIAAVGDSRIYLIRANTIFQLTVDHTWVQEAMDQGLLRPEQARSHPNAHVIRRYLGSRSGVVPDLRLKLPASEDDEHALTNQGASVLPGDILLLCSDGLTDLVDDWEILAALQTHRSDEALDELVNLSNQRGGHDNITIVALSAPAIEQPTIPIAVRKQRSRLALLASVGVVSLLLLVAVLAIGALWLVGRASRPVLTATPHILEKSTLFPDPAYTESPGGSQDAPQPSARVPLTSPTPNRALASPRPGVDPAGIDPGGATLTPWPTNTLIP